MRVEAGRRPVPSVDRIILLILDLLLLGFALNLTLQPLVEPDFGWHLRAGLDLVAHGWTVPDTDPYSHTMPDWRWVEHAWLTDGLLGLLYLGLEPAGALGVILFFGIVTALAWWIAAGQASVPRTYRLAAMVASLWVALPFLGARTQLISLLGVAVLLRIWRQIQRGRRQWIWVLPALFVCWANLHGGFTAGLFLSGVLIFGALLERICADSWPALAASLDEPVLAWEDLRQVVLALGIAAVLTWLNPYGWRLYVEIYDSLMDRYMIETLREWQPVSFQGWAGQAYGFYLAGLAFVVVGWYRRVEPVRWLMLAVLLALSLLHWRNITLFLIVSVPLVAELLPLATATCLQWVPALKTYATVILLAFTIVASSGLFLLGPEHVSHVWRAGTSPQDYFEQSDYPIEAVRWIRSHHEEIGTRLYNDYGYGGFLLWQLPGEKIFIDGRMPAWRIGDRRIFQDYMDLNREHSPEISILDRYRVDWALIPRGSGLALALESHPLWKVLYADGKAVILRRQEQVDGHGRESLR